MRGWEKTYLKLGFNGVSHTDTGTGVSGEVNAWQAVGACVARGKGEDSVFARAKRTGLDGDIVGNQDDSAALDVFRSEEGDLPRHHTHVIETRGTGDFHHLKLAFLLLCSRPLLDGAFFNQGLGSALADDDELFDGDDLLEWVGGWVGGLMGLVQ